ncbi:MAG: phosphodiester glycosidase family protein [Chitinivibrionales bacterium]|nr:phosphodiester glycosidase family protein [Chitinivibrionales bacterium]MBD3397179.1 phosphodiester glycosidase family protein [Chitinivibrionales bacterium]
MMCRNCVLLIPVAFAVAAAGSWKTLDTGLDLGIFTAPKKSHTGDSRITVVRIDPARYHLQALCAGELDSVNLTVGEWCRKHNLVAAINAGMYAKDYRTHVGYLKNFAYVNSGRVRTDYKAVLAFNPVDKSVAPVRIIDLACHDFRVLREKYNTLIQNLRMVSCRGSNVWSPQEKRYSLAALGIDKSGRVLFLFSESPYSVHDFIDIILSLPLSVKGAMYLEGGGAAALYLQSGEFVLERYGVYESGEHTAGTLSLPRPLPNVIGVDKR